MKTNRFKFLLLFLPLLILNFNAAEAQLLKRLKQKAEDAATRKLEQKVEEKTEEAMDEVLEPESTETPEVETPEDVQDDAEGPAKPGSTANKNTTAKTPGPKSIGVYSNFDFVAGDQIILFEDFSVDNIGDFPAKWNTDGTGEVVKIDGSNDKWFKLTNDSEYIPDLPKTLPENYTIEFDVLATNLNDQTSSYAQLHIYIEDQNTFKRTPNFIRLEIPFCQYAVVGYQVYNYFRDSDPYTTISNTVDKDLRKLYLNKVHVSIAVNGKRVRMWINENKVIDVPRLIIETNKLKYLKFLVQGFEHEKRDEQLLITNIKIAEGGLDLRSKLLKEGKFSTTGILFDSGSDKIKPESYGTLKQIADALSAESSMNIKIVGHTDADGSEEANMELSKKRAASVKNMLVSQFGIADTRLQTDGKGESQPVGDNTKTEGKAQNRRVEFIKI